MPVPSASLPQAPAGQENLLVQRIDPAAVIMHAERESTRRRVAPSLVVPAAESGPMVTCGVRRSQPCFTALRSRLTTIASPAFRCAPDTSAAPLDDHLYARCSSNRVARKALRRQPGPDRPRGLELNACRSVPTRPGLRGTAAIAAGRPRRGPCPGRRRRARGANRRFKCEKKLSSKKN